MYRLKLRELLMPRVVSQVEEGNPMAKSRSLRSWRVSPELFPCELPAQLQEQADKAVEVNDATALALHPENMMQKLINNVFRVTLSKGGMGHMDLGCMACQS